MITLIREPRVACLLILSVSLAALGAAYASEVWGGLKPCVLCIYQRYAYVLAGALGLVGLAPGLGQRQRRWLVGLGGLAFLGGAAIAFFHVGVEQHWWRGTAACHAPVFDPTLSLEELRERMLATDFVPCDTIPWSLFGLSIAGYNAIASLALGLISLWAARPAGTERTA